MKKAKLLGALLAGVMAVTGVPQLAEPLAVVASAASKLAAPTGISGSATDTSVKISWKAVSGADAYRVFKYNSKTKKYDTLKNVSAASCNITGLTAGTSYVFRVAALVKSGSNYTVQTLSADIKVTTKLSAPANLKAVKASGSSVKLTWSAVKGADAYRVYFYDDTAGSFKTYNNVSGTSCTVKSLQAGYTYKFAVAALVKKGNSYTAQAMSKAVSASVGENKKSGGLFDFPAFGISGAEAAKALGLTDYQKQTQDMKGASITAYTGFITVNGQTCVAVLMENSKKQYFAGMVVYDQKVTSFSNAYGTVKASLGKPAVNMDAMGMQMYMWMDKSINVTMLMGADADGQSMTLYYTLSYKYAPDEIKESMGSGNMTDISGLFT